MWLNRIKFGVAVIDLCMREVVGWAMSDSTDTNLTPSDVMFHSTREVSTAVACSVNGYGDIGHYLMTHFNWQRPHSYNGGLPPAKAEKLLTTKSGNS